MFAITPKDNQCGLDRGVTLSQIVYLFDLYQRLQGNFCIASIINTY